MPMQESTTIDGHRRVVGMGGCCPELTVIALRRSVPENEFGIGEQEPKPGRRYDNQGDRRDEIPKALLRHRQRIS